MSKKQGAKCKYLLDASSLYPILLSGKAVNLDQCAVSTLTEYELGNVLWKEAKTKRIDFTAAAQTFSDALSEMKKISINGIGEVLQIAVEKSLTFYDASYVFIAEKENLKLVTEDTELLRKCKLAMGTKEFTDSQFF